MRIQTNAGEVGLTAEMVTRGMVLQSPAWRIPPAPDGVLTMKDPRGGGDWYTTDQVYCNPIVAEAVLLGCDPAIATRAACERFGVHGDAGAHGFVRLRDGGAVDLRRVARPGVVVGFGDGQRFVPKHRQPVSLGDGQWFVGLNPDVARIEDVLRMCCGAPLAGNADSVVRCTLAIGDHEQHEDLATGVKWAAKQGCAAECSSCGCRGRCPWSGPLKKSDEDAVACESCGCEWCGPRRCDDRHRSSLGDARCNLPACHTLEAHRDVMGETWENFDQSPATGKRASVTAGCPCDALGRGAPGLHTKDCKAGRALKWEMGTASLGQSQAHVVRDGDVYRWQVNHLGLRIRDGVEPHTFDAHAAAGRILFAVHDATAGIEWLAEFFGLLFRVHDSTPAAMRAKQEAPLVALVAAVPAGLDPIGWRAAVLCLYEDNVPGGHADRLARFFDWSKSALDSVAVAVRCNVPARKVRLTVDDDAIAAYRRAISPAPKVDRVRATWKTRGPALPCDNGEDE